MLKFVAALCVLVVGCAPPCGNGAVDGKEACDEGMANGTYGHCRADCSAKPQLVGIEGDVLGFTTEVEGPRISGAKVFVLEHPEISVVTGPDAHFSFKGIEAGTDLTLVVEHPDYKTTQTGTVTPGTGGINPFPIQVVSKEMFTLLASLMPQAPQEQFFCAIATTAARMGGSLYTTLRQGMPDVKVTLEPAARPESGPVYFNKDVIPDRTALGTSIDGGLLYYRVPPGKYVLKPTKAGTAFNEVRFECRVGVVVNAGPPMGPLANVVAPDFSVGGVAAADEFTASTDGLCEATAKCVNEKKGAGTYPVSMLASCKATFRNMWAFTKEPCATSSNVRAAGKALFTCRASTCANTLGGDAVCVAEEDAFRAAEATYGACLTK